MKPVLPLLGLGALVAMAGTARADDNLTVRSQIGLAPTVVPDKAQLTTQLGFEGAGSVASRGEATGLVEATLLPRLSVFAAVQYGDEAAGASQPSIGVAYQIADPRTAAIGARISVAYKGEGFSELDGESETVLMLSKLHGADLGRVMLAYGFDPDFHDSDGEFGASYLHAVASDVALGATSRLRYAFASNPDGGLRWDLFGGAAGEVTFGHWRIEALAGVSSVDLVMSGSVKTGAFGLVSVGYDL